MDRPPLPDRPRLRGVLHAWAFAVSLVAGAALVALAPSPAARVAGAVYALSLSAMLGVSALYHCVTWRPAARTWMRRLDHATIFVVIAGTYTPFAVVVLDASAGAVVLGVAWGGAAVGAVLELLWRGGPRWRSVIGYVALGWASVWIAPELVRRPAVFALLLGGGVLYTIGAVVYARQRPDPRPAVFGYHEVFHALVVVAALLHFVAVSLVLSDGSA